MQVLRWKLVGFQLEFREQQSISYNLDQVSVT